MHFRILRFPTIHCLVIIRNYNFMPECFFKSFYHALIGRNPALKRKYRKEFFTEREV